MVVRLIKITLMITFLVVVSAASFIWGYRAHRETEVDYFNGLLYNLDIEVDLLEHWNENKGQEGREQEPSNNRPRHWRPYFIP